MPKFQAKLTASVLAMFFVQLAILAPEISLAGNVSHSKIIVLIICYSFIQLNKLRKFLPKKV